MVLHDCFLVGGVSRGTLGWAGGLLCVVFGGCCVFVLLQSKINDWVAVPLAYLWGAGGAGGKGLVCSIGRIIRAAI